MIVEQIGEILAEHWLTILAILGLIGCRDFSPDRKPR
jgi:hypothetical protein